MTVRAPAARPVPRQLVVLVWAGLASLLLIGITAAALRAIYLTDLYGVAEPLHKAVLGAFGVSEPNAVSRADMIARADAKFAAHALATLLHVGLGTLMFVLLPLQFSKFIRARYRAFHRWSGRLLVVAAWIIGLGGLFFGVLHPIAGHFERFIIGLIGAWFLASISIAYVSIRRRQTAKHREWMLRAVGAAVGISMMRVVMIPLDLVLTSRAVRPEVVFLHSIWIGVGLTALGAEWWIRRTRPARASAA
jgi:hypothetical protein